MFKSLTTLNYFFGLLIKDPASWSQGRLNDYPKRDIAPLEIKRSKRGSFFFFVRTQKEKDRLAKSGATLSLPSPLLRRKYRDITVEDLERAVSQYQIAQKNDTVPQNVFFFGEEVSDEFGHPIGLHVPDHLRTAEGRD